MKTEKTKVFKGKINGIVFYDEDEYENVESIILEIERKMEKEVNESKFVEIVRDFSGTATAPLKWWKILRIAYLCQEL